jgi:2-polyprenyl-6-methoxyphenol hydroxylase-like FAD-dependent oxidoreductase
LARIDFDGLPTSYPFTLMVPQNLTESILQERLRELGSDVYRGYEVQDLRQDMEGVSVEISTVGQQQTQTVRARYVIGADGMRSIVRERAAIGFTGDSYEQSFVLADIRMEWLLGGKEVMLFFSPEGLVVVAPLPGGFNRVVATVDEAPEHPTLANVQSLLDRRGPLTQAARIKEISWSSRFRVHHRLANYYRDRRVLLAGDAAHVHSPAGGQGMNTGIQDAMTLSKLLVEVIVGGAPESRLDEYEQNRRPVAERVVAFTHRMTRIATVRSGFARTMRNVALRFIGKFEFARRWLATELSGLRNRPKRSVEPPDVSPSMNKTR